MNYLDEMKSFVLLHSRAQQLDEETTRNILDSIDSIEHDRRGSWSHAFSHAATQMLERQRWLDAVKLFNLARFPFVEHIGQHHAHDGCIFAFQAWINANKLKVETISLMNGAFKVYATGLDRGWPVLIVTGGIVSIKEQWHRLLIMAEQLKRCVVIAEMPGVGENTLPYTLAARAMYPTILNALQGRADTNTCHLLALSFSGHLALLHAAEDTRISGITTVGAPIAGFFNERQWFEQLPEVTKRTLSHLTKLEPNTLFDGLQHWALSPSVIAQIKVPVFYLQSQYDEIIPAGEVAALKSVASNVNAYLLPDVHGSPNHMDLMGLWIVASILSTHPKQQIRAILMRLLWRLRSATKPRMEFHHV